MPRGGRRAGAGTPTGKPRGRPVGSRDKAKRRKRQDAPIVVAPNPDGPPHGGIEWLKKARAEGREATWLDRIEKDALEKNDVENLKWLAAWGGSNLDGLPAKRSDVGGKDFGEIIREAAQRAQAHRLEREKAAALAPPPESLITAPVSRPALPPAPEQPAETIVSPEPVQTATGLDGWPKPEALARLIRFTPERK